MRLLPLPTHGCNRIDIKQRWNRGTGHGNPEKVGSIVGDAALPCMHLPESTMHEQPSPLWKLPSQCMICHAWPAQSICQTCRQAHIQVHARCAGCALLLPPDSVTGAGDHTPHWCASCLRLPLDGIDGCHAAVSYGWPWQACVDGFKFGAQTGWATALAGVMLRDPLVRQAIRTCDVLVPMPLHPLRLAERGYNQSLLLAQALRRCTDREEKLDRHQAVVRHDWLLRISNTQAQSRLSLAQRLRNIRQAFAVAANQSSQLHGKRVVLVDDVMTSGASAQAAAQTLRTAGVHQLRVVVFARTEKP